jgi:hypothetical protein
MHKLLQVAGRRTAGLAAGVILTGGIAGGVLLTPGTAFAGNAPVDTSTSVSVSQSSGYHGATLNVSVSVTAANNSNGTPSGSVWVSGAGGGCSAALNGSGDGSCNIYNVPGGTYTLTGTYAANSLFNGSSGSASITVSFGSAPVFVADSPSTSATGGQNYYAAFRAVGSPQITYSLSGPGWLHIDSYSGAVYGTVPYYGGSFSYSVTATNSVGSATAGPYTVWVSQPQHNFYSNLSTSLNCTSPVHNGQRGTCTLWVTDNGNSAASNVTAQIALPWQLRADYCGYFFGYGCSIANNTASQNLGTIYAGQTKSLTVVFTARTGYGLWGWHHGFRFTVKVVGSATSFGGYYGYFNRTSYAAAYVTIIPRGWWA